MRLIKIYAIAYRMRMGLMVVVKRESCQWIKSAISYAESQTQYML